MTTRISEGIRSLTLSLPIRDGMVSQLFYHTCLPLAGMSVDMTAKLSGICVQPDRSDRIEYHYLISKPISYCRSWSTEPE